MLFYIQCVDVTPYPSCKKAQRSMTETNDKWSWILKRAGKCLLCSNVIDQPPSPITTTTTKIIPKLSGLCV